jgi:hypothetical protein
MSILFGSSSSRTDMPYYYREPQWKAYLEDAPESVIKETGMSRKELQKTLEVLYEHRIIN